MKTKTQDQQQIRLSPTERGPVKAERKIWDRAGKAAKARGSNRNAMLSALISVLADADPTLPLTVTFPPRPTVTAAPLDPEAVIRQGDAAMKEMVSATRTIAKAHQWTGKEGILLGLRLADAISSRGCGVADLTLRDLTEIIQMTSREHGELLQAVLAARRH